LHSLTETADCLAQRWANVRNLAYAEYENHNHRND